MLWAFSLTWPNNKLESCLKLVAAVRLRHYGPVQKTVSEQNYGSKSELNNCILAPDKAFSTKNSYCFSYVFMKTYTVELQWLEYLWDHGNLFEIWIVLATEG